MEVVLELVLPIILYTLGAILLTVLILIGIKFLKALNNINRILEDTYKKTQSLNGIFHTIDTVTDKVSLVSDVLTEKITQLIMNMFKKKAERKERKKEEENL